MSLAWSDFGDTLEHTVAKPKFVPAIAGDATNYICTQQYRQLLGTYSPPALNAVHPDFAGFYFVGDGEQNPLGGGVVEWTRRWAKVPATHNEFQSFPCPLIGLFYTAGPVVTTNGRFAKVLPVTSRMQHDYFLTGSGGTYTGPGAIPINRGFFFCFQYSTSSILGSLFFPTTILGTNTVPTVALYQLMIQDALSKSWTAAVQNQLVNVSNGAVQMDVGNNGQIAAEDSRLERWEGNIYKRVTRYVLAQ